MKKTILSVLVVGLPLMAHAANFQLNATRIYQVSTDSASGDGQFVVKENAVTQAVPAKSACYNANDATYELIVSKAHPTYKEVMAMVMASHLMGRSLTLSTDDNTCRIKGFGLTKGE